MKLDVEGFANKQTRRAFPFLKWAGGKKQLLDPIMALVPERFERYLEPFLGGGAVFFRLASEGRVSTALLNDANPHLVTTYVVVRDRLPELIESLSRLKAAHGPEHFYEARRRFNQEPLSDVDRAAHLIYLNKTCFNGLYRVNSSGGFNVPFGRYVNPGIFDTEALSACSAALQGVLVQRGDFEEVMDTAAAGDFIYLDPPYVPLTRTANFTSYAREGFTFDDQIRLARAVRRLDSVGVRFLLSNHYTDELVGLYEGFDVKVVPARRSITRQASDRAIPVDEVLIRNF